MKKLKVTLSIIAVAMLLLLTACSGGDANSAVEEETTAQTSEESGEESAESAGDTAAEAPSEEYAPLRMVTSFTIDSLDPVADGFWLAEYGSAELLMQYRSDGKYYPWLLKSLEQIDDNTWLMTLRDGITFQNGKALTIDGVLAVINRQMELSSSAQSRIPAGTTFEVTGDNEITVSTEAPFPDLAGALAHEAVFPIYDVEAVDAVGEDFDALQGAGFYTGPYTVVSLDDQEMVMERYEGYWAGRPALPGVSLQFVSDAQARILAVQNGEADIANYPPTEAKPVVDATEGIHFLYGWPSTGGFRIILKTSETPFNDLAVRKALMRAIDYDEIANDVMYGVVQPATGFYPEWAPFSIQNQYTDLAEAQQLLEDAGWVAGDDGIRQKDGERLVVNLIIYPQQPDLGPISEAMQAQLLKAGFEINIASVDSILDTMENNTSPWNLGMTSSGAIAFGGSVDSTLLAYNHTDGSRNYVHHSNPELDALIDELSVTLDEGRRTEILAQIQVILIEEDPQQFFAEFHTDRVIVNDLYQDYHPGMGLYFVHYLTKPGVYETPTFDVE